MIAARWAQIKEIFCAARERPGRERAAWVDQACGGDDQLRDEVQRLLAQDDGTLPSPVDLLVRAAPVIPAGEMLAHYRLETKLGQGGMGTVYRAHDTRLQRTVALKVLSPEHVADPNGKGRLLREARAASALNDPNIVAIYDVGSDKGVDYIAMEFVEGRILDEQIPDKGLPVAQALDYAEQIAAGLAKAHAAGVIHRDLKPGNVMVRSDGLVKLLDFGLARRFRLEPGQETTVTIQGELVGTPAYMSPEQAEGKPLDSRSDIFSFGVVLYEMLAGQRAFRGDSTAGVLAAVIGQEPIALGEKVPRELQKIVTRCLRKDPARRYQHMGDVEIELEELQGEAAAERLDSAVQHQAQRPRRWRWITAVLLATVAGIVIRPWLSSDAEIDVSRLRYTPVVTVMHQRRIDEGGGIGAQLPAWSPDGKSIAYSANGLRLQRVDSSESSSLTDNGVVPFFSADGTRIFYLTSGETRRELWSVSVAGGAPERVLPDLGGFGPLLSGVAMSPDGKALAVLAPRETGSDDMSIWVSSPPGAPLRPYAGSPRGRFLVRAPMRFSHDGSRLLVLLIAADYSVNWWLLKWPPPSAVQEGAVRRLFESAPRGWLDFGGDWLLDDRHLVVSVPEQGDHGGPLWIADTVTQNWQRLTPGPLNHLGPAVSRDGRILVNISRTDENALEIPLDGSAIRPLLTGFRREQYPVWSPVAEQILFVSHERGAPEIWLASRKEGWQRPVVTQGDFPPQANVRQFFCPAFSPDGMRVAYTSDGAIWVSQISGGPAIRIAEGHCATWSPDGTWLAFVPRDNRALMKVPVGQRRDLAFISHVGGRFLPRWSPDGKWITIQLPDGFGVVSPDGARTKILHKGPLDFGSASGWSRDGSTLFLAYPTPQGRILSGFMVATGAEMRVRNLGSLYFSYFLPYSAGLSPSPDGKSLAASTWRVRFEPWILDGIEPPRTFWRRLFHPW